MKYGTKLAIVLLGIVVTFAAVISYVAYTSNIRTVELEIKGRLEDTAFHVMDKIDRMLFERFADIQVMASDPLLDPTNATPRQIRRRLSEYRNLHKTYISLSFFDLDRVRIADTAGLSIGVQDEMTTFWQDVLDDKVSAANDIHVEKSLRLPVIYFASPVKDRDGETLGIVVARMTVDKLYYAIKEAAEIYEEHEKELKIDLVNRDGLLLYSNTNTKGIMKDTHPAWEAIKKFVAKEKDYGSLIHFDRASDEKGVYAFSTERGYMNYKGHNWILLVQIATEDAFASTVELRNKMILIGVLLTALSIFIIVFFSRTISKPITKLIKGAEMIGKGNLGYRVELIRRDEIGILANTFDEMLDRLQTASEESESQNWLNVGQSELDDRMRGDQSIDELCKNIMVFIANYLKVQVGTLYVNAGEGLFKLRAGYAYTGQKNLTNEFKTGEGMVGQAAFEKKSKVLTNIPEDYITVISGLGEKKPRNILVVPFVSNETVAGVLEVGSFDEFSELQTTFLDQISERVAIAINSSLARVALDKTLEKSQRQAEEMESQQEELRAANEELEEQTQNLQASEVKLQTMQQDMEEKVEISSRIAQTFFTESEEEMYATVLDIVLEVMDSPYGVFGYVDENGALIVPSMTRHIWGKCKVPEKHFVFPREEWGDSSWPRAMQEKRPNFTNERSKKTPEGHIAVERHISLPIMYQGEPIGLFQVANRNTHYTEEDVRTLEGIGQQIAPILNARLQRNIQDVAREGAEEELSKRDRELERMNKEMVALREETKKRKKESMTATVPGDVTSDSEPTDTKEGGD